MQDRETRSGRLRSLFERCEELERLSRRIEEEVGAPRAERWTQEKARVRRLLREGLEQAPPALFERLLPAVLEELTTDDRILVLVLLNRRLRDGDAAVSGRELLWTLHDNAFDVMEAIPRLASGSPLRRLGLLVCIEESDGRQDVLEDVFTLSQRTYDRIVGAGARETTSPRELAYADDAELLLDLNRLAQAYQRRAARIFDGAWRVMHGEPEETPESLTAAIDALRAEIGGRLEATPEATQLTLQRFRQERGLSGIELLIVVTLLCHEALEGQGSVDAIDLLRMVSVSEREMLRKRGLFAPEARLVEQGIVLFEEGFADKSLTGQAFLADWVTEALLDGQVRAGRKIAVDERIEFHRYLDDLDGSEDFFRRLS